MMKLCGFPENTLIMMLVTLVGQVGIAIVLALMVDNITHGKHFSRRYTSSLS